MQKNNCFYRKVVKDLTFEQVESGFEVKGYRPHFLINGTWSGFIDDLPFFPSEQWTENCPWDCPVHNVYNIVFDTNLETTSLGPEGETIITRDPRLEGMTLKSGAFIKITYYIKVECD